jgi:solute carrier family 10 (sodium/bile acid cotransporter), member 7
LAAIKCERKAILVRMPRWLPLDPYILVILAVVVLAFLLPLGGQAADAASTLTTAAIALLFFLHGARIAPREAAAGARHWRLHLVALLSTFALFPLLGLAARPLQQAVLSPELYHGLLFLCAVPSTVQSSIAFTSLAKGNVPAAIFSASFSNLLGVLLTPVLCLLLLGGGIGLRMNVHSVLDIVLQLVVPFAAGQAMRPWIAAWVDRHRRLVTVVDRGSILLVVYTAFSAGVVAGIWPKVSPARLLALLAVDAVLLAIVLLTVTLASRTMRFSVEDRITAVFCGSKKSLATGLPMAAVLFRGQTVGLVVLPLMLFHQIQLIVCAALARRWGRRLEPQGPNQAVEPQTTGIKTRDLALPPAAKGTATAGDRTVGPQV